MRVGSFLASPVPSRGDRAAETGAVCRYIFAASIAAAQILVARRIYSGGFEMPRGRISVIGPPLARWWRYASLALSMSIEVAATKRDVKPSSPQKSHSHTRAHTDAAVSRHIRCCVRRRGCCQQQLGIGARCSSRRRARWSAGTASEILRDIQIRQPQRCVGSLCGNQICSMASRATST